MDHIKISIIMPVYNVERYIARAIESIQKQTLKDWELFLVDDGSPDKSGIICDEYAKEDSRLHVIHKENGGAPSARNVAIDLAKGEYMYFMDSDDWVEPAMLEDMMNLANENNLQLVVSGYYIDTYYSNDSKFTQEQFVNDVIYKTQDDFRADAHKLFDHNLLYTPWNKLYLSKYILDQKIYFPNTFWDDFPFNLSVIKDIQRVGVTSNKYYHFIRQRGDSETAKYRNDMYLKREEEHQWMLSLYDYWQVHSEESYEFLCRRYIERIIGCIENITNKNCNLSRKEKKLQIKSIINDIKVSKAVKATKPRSYYMKLMLLPIKWHSSTLVYLEGCTISAIKSKNTKFFAKLKAKR